MALMIAQHSVKMHRKGSGLPIVQAISQVKFERYMQLSLNLIMLILFLAKTKDSLVVLYSF